jgi:hypothetical protein
VPLGVLNDVTNLIGGIPFQLTYVIIRPTSPSSYQVLLGRPWLYGANVRVNWPAKEFSFGRPRTVISWDLDKYQGETQPEEEYTLGSTDTSSDEEGDTTDEDFVKLIHVFEIDYEVNQSGITREISVPDVTVQIPDPTGLVPDVTVNLELLFHPEPEIKPHPEPELSDHQAIRKLPQKSTYCQCSYCFQLHLKPEIHQELQTYQELKKVPDPALSTIE